MNGVHLIHDLKKANAITHSGKWHADDILSTILLLLVLGEVFLLRVPEVTKNMVSRFKPPIIYDIGGGAFDHHQANAPIRPNGIRYAAFGLLWRAYGVRILKEHYNCSHSDAVAIAEMFDRDFVQGIDYADNKKDNAPSVHQPMVCLSSLIASFNPSWEDPSQEAEEKGFMRALDFAYIAFDESLSKTISKFHARPIVERAIAENTYKNILVLPHYVEWKEWLLSSEQPKAKDILYVIFPSKRMKGYDIMSVPKRIGSKFLRKPFPISWAGLEGHKLEEALNVPMAYFCHPERYMASARTIDAALNMAALSMIS